MVWASDVQEEQEINEEDDDHVDRLFTFEVTKTNEQEEDVVSRPGITVRESSITSADANAKKVDLSMLFPEPGVTEECPTTLTPAFLAGEKRQAIYTTAFIRPEKKVEKVTQVINRLSLGDYLYVTSSL